MTSVPPTGSTGQNGQTGCLLHLLSDLTRDPALRDRLTQDPLAVIARYGVSPDKQAILRSRDIEQIASTIGREAKELIAQLRETSPTVMVPWPSHEILVKAIKPDRGATGTQLSVEVTGRQFAPAATLRFTHPGAPVVRGTDIRVHTGAEGQSTMWAKASFTKAGVYDVIVTNPDNEHGTLSAGFTAFDK